DILTVEASAATKILCSDPAVPTDSRNICWKAIDILRKRFALASSAAITIQKNIPVMGGLAGGSANAATALLMLNRLWQLHCTRPQLMELGRELGMDVPYYFIGNTAFDSETTGRLEALSAPCELAFILVVPSFGVPTKEAYREIDYAKTGKQTIKTNALQQALSLGDYTAIARNCHNDFEFSVFAKHPELATIKNDLLRAGCDAAFLSGSGSTMAGLAQSKEAAMAIAARLPYKTIVTATHCAEITL
ncbi:MAG: 4-(cytidine 5'-diphospho)-2-C-methyl-D-erythritol kinase, partial [Chitinivibrionales bacterium]|nr:4-(cytidine 5'-diphospho)-2-C-methyl-D-erythritol kinase [Chitinivibrionales bacterium]